MVLSAAGDHHGDPEERTVAPDYRRGRSHLHCRRIPSARLLPGPPLQAGRPDKGWQPELRVGRRSPFARSGRRWSWPESSVDRSRIRCLILHSPCFHINGARKGTQEDDDEEK